MAGSSDITQDTGGAADGVLVESAGLRGLYTHGLPVDDLHANNSVLAEFGPPRPLMIEPQGHANRRVRNTGNENRIVIAKLLGRIYLNSLGSCFRNGRALLNGRADGFLGPASPPCW